MEEQTATLMYRNINYIFSFITQIVGNGKLRERVDDDWDVRIVCDTNVEWTTSFSLCFREAGTGPPQGIESS